MRFTVLQDKPGIEEYNFLRSAADWPVYEEHLVKRALGNSLFSVVVRDEAGRIIGMGRIVGDGAIYLHVQDVIVHPEYQRMGVGKMIMKALMEYIDEVADHNTNIGLMCSNGRERFYRNFGFIDRPNEKFGAGMIMIKV